ncbi:MAG: hypothetical protein KME52_14340 [Desmonostoc geniculatum HA4340-LM1]|jgi:hypothetical protein|nr:hypothetical protein [Desmonostoc geniculatum HA4340-LM1]
MAKKYIVDLNEDEVSQLQSIIKKGKHKARSITRANILLMASEGETDQAIAEGASQFCKERERKPNYSR